MTETPLLNGLTPSIPVPRLRWLRFDGQDTKMSSHGKVRKGRIEPRKEPGQFATMHPGV